MSYSTRPIRRICRLKKNYKNSGLKFGLQNKPIYICRRKRRKREKKSRPLPGIPKWDGENGRNNELHINRSRHFGPRDSHTRPVSVSGKRNVREQKKRKVMENSVKHQLVMSWTRFVVVCGFLAAINAIYTPHQLWCLWIVAGWGMGQILQSVDYWLKVKKI